MTTLHRTPTCPDDLARIADVRAMCATGEARRIRLMARVSLREVAAVVGADHKAVERWESGRTRPTSGFALAYGEALNAMARHATPTPTRRSR